MKILKACVSCDFYYWGESAGSGETVCPQCSEPGELLPFDHEDLDLIATERDRLRRHLFAARATLSEISDIVIRLNQLLEPLDLANDHERRTAREKG